SRFSCVFMDSCVLPCSFQPDAEEVIHWIQLTAGSPPVHSYYSDQDQLNRQAARFRGRTSLFRDQISGGNASLRLSEVNLQDESRYKCYTSTTRGNKETFISLEVEAPVGKVDIQQVENTVTCSSKGIYPAPELTWSTSPPSDPILQKPTNVQKNHQQLFDISSSLLISTNNTQTAYFCTVSTGSSRRKATLSQLPPVSVSSNTDTSIPCNDKTSDLRRFSITWRFNHSETILTQPSTQTQTQTQTQVQEQWKQQVKGLSESGSLELRALSQKQEGTYTCELSDAEETLITNTLLKIDPAEQTGGPNIVANIVVSVLVFIVNPLWVFSLVKHRQRKLKTRMTGVQRVVSLVVVSLIWSVTLARGDSRFSCVFMDSCILPCSFQPDTEEIIHWIQLTAGSPPVHSYYSGQDQLGHQAARFRGRTSLFRDQISRGNASLRLSEVNLQDESRYKCYTSTTRGNKETFISLEVEAPVGKVDIQQVENTVTCSSKGIYPAPELTWSTSPPSDPILQKPTTVQKNHQQLFDISSFLLISTNNTQTAYFCTVSTGSSRRKATLSQLPPVTVSSNTDTSIPCNDKTSDLRRFSIAWRFNHSETILTQPSTQTQTQTQTQVQVQEQWKQQVKGLSESGSLELQALSQKREGTYTCELSDAEETLITNTLLKIDPAEQTGGPNIVAIIVVPVLLVLFIIVVVLVIFLKKRCNNREQQTVQSPEENPLKNTSDQSYKDRTSVFPDQVLRGNASLCLRNITVRDQGRYKCCPYIDSNTDVSSYVSVVVKAPVGEVDIQLVGDKITCTSRGIYPEPDLTWSTSPPSTSPLSILTLHDSTRVQLNPQGLYDITSSQRMMG
uniref:uncharacterized protein n=1 Tax=Centroberyx gerrardi TaxID=166262 RepID=UPI003AAAC1C5